MEELKTQRNYRVKSFGDPNGGISLQHIFAGDIHYDNKLGVGDGKTGFREISNTLEWNEARRGWTFFFHNYQPFIPEYADDWILYRDLYKGKDQISGFRARTAGHVAGKLVENIPGLTNANAVIYDDALGPGIDLIVCFTFKKMRKIVRIRDGFKPAVDTDFDFEIRYPDLVDVYEKDPDTGILTPITPGQAYTLKSRSEIYIGTDQLDGRDWFTRVNPVRVWDSGAITGQGFGQRCVIAPAALAIVNGRTYLRKRITAAMFAASVGDVFTDATFAYTENKDTYYGTAFTTGGAPDAETLNIGGWGDTYYSYIEWDLTGTLASNDTLKCWISLHIEGVAVNNSQSMIQRITASWTEAGVTSAANPAATTTDEVNMPNIVPMGSRQRVNLDITHFYKGWKDGTFSNFGVKISGLANPTNAAHSLSSSDHTDGSIRHPLLIVSGYPKPLVDKGRIRPRPFAPGRAR